MLSVIFISILLILAAPSSIFALTQTPSPSPTKNETITDQISQLKDKIASRVAQLNLVEKRGIIGTVSDVSSTQLTISDLRQNTRFVDVDELTKFSSPSAKTSFGISDITKGTTIGVLGTYNKQSRRILARFVSVLNLDTKIFGTIIDVDKKNFTVTVTSSDNKQYIVDHENNTKLQFYTANLGLVRGGLSKLQIGKMLYLAIYKNPKTSRFSADRIIQFNDIGTSQTPTPTNPASSTATPSSKTR